MKQKSTIVAMLLALCFTTQNVNHLFVVVIICALTLQSCERSPSIVDDPTPYLFVSFIKLSSPQYLDYVVVEKDYQGDCDCLCEIRSAGATCQEFYIGSSPYIALPNGYYLIDWKWGTFIYEPTNFLIDVKWTDVENRRQKWEYNSHVITDKFLKEWGRITYKEIDKYLNVIPPTDIDSIHYNNTPVDYIRPYWMYRYNSLADVPDSVLQSYLASVNHLDSLQNVYKERISKIIGEDALDNAILSSFLFKY